MSHSQNHHNNGGYNQYRGGYLNQPSRYQGQYRGNGDYQASYSSSHQNSYQGNNQYGAGPRAYQGAPQSHGGYQQAHDKFQLWMGELDQWWDENAIKQIWSAFGETASNVKLIRDKTHNGNAGYCFVSFATQEAAQSALLKNGLPIPGTAKVLKLNWASGGAPGASTGTSGYAPSNGPASEYAIFVGDLQPDVGDKKLYDLFISKFPTCVSARVMTDQVTNNPKGYGFVKFTAEADQQRALNEMNGFMLSGRPIRVSTAASKNQQQQQQHYQLHHTLSYGSGANTGSLGSAAAYVSATLPIFHQQQPQLTQHTDPNNTTVFIGGLSNLVSEDELKSYFRPFGDIIYVKIPAGKSCGFVQFVTRPAAELAITQMQSFPIHNSRIRLSWGRSNFQNLPVVDTKTQYKALKPQPLIYGQYPSSPSYEGNILSDAFNQQSPAVEEQRMMQRVVEPTEPLENDRLNALYLAARDGRLDRLEANGDWASFCLGAV
ncbi:hypothetical protein BABINDRAFT_160002 [Babjeviella inositovora NRRL Y-12698]|uniref:RRM domain-containing protein n=1 Tax=Babjeviella inositovora NRRL Y-12698 TaxID=984486 RepID=A0A1E3QVT2_9ASCO|nr:uncharacterized protein BABINDRAFT_160002 [Babjeviella inositovora NRRL Y-12698]ODQ81763.1 hypothetical protein BABINDRAFT_160002 [Babjeviella inositovora NRRL Y-12698]